MTDCDNHRIVWIEVLWIKLVIVWLDHSTTCIAILLLHLIEFILHHLLAKFWIVQDLVQVVDGLHQLIELVMQLLQTQACQLAEAHVNDSLTLQFVEFKTLLQVALSIRRRLAGTDDMNHLINIIAGDNQSLEDMSTLLCLLQFKLSTTDCNIMTMINEVLHAFLQTQETWTAINKSDTIY